MKKYLLFILICLLVPSTVFASTNRYTRTYEDLRIGKGIVANDSNINIIMNTPSVDASEKIYDYAELLTDSEEEKLFKTISAFIDAYSTDFAVVTVKENPYSYIDSNYSYDPDSYSMKFADDFYDYNDFGIGYDYTGVLLLIDLSNRYIWISSTGEARRYFNYYDDVFELLDHSISLYTAGDYYEAITDTIYIMSEYYSHDLNYYTGGNYVNSKTRSERVALSSWMLIASVIMTAIFCFINVSKCKMAKIATNAKDYQNVLGVNLVNDILIHTSHSSYRMSSSSSSGGGGSHHSSSGFSHGGGGHHF